MKMIMDLLKILFKDSLVLKGKIENGPFSNYIFNIISKDKE